MPNLAQPPGSDLYRPLPGTADSLLNLITPYITPDFRRRVVFYLFLEEAAAERGLPPEPWAV